MYMKDSVDACTNDAVQDGGNERRGARWRGKGENEVGGERKNEPHLICKIFKLS